MHNQKIIRVGNSLAVTLPSRIVKKVGIKLADIVNVSLANDGSTIILALHNPRQLTLISPKNNN